MKTALERGLKEVDDKSRKIEVVKYVKYRTEYLNKRLLKPSEAKRILRETVAEAVKEFGTHLAEGNAYMIDYYAHIAEEYLTNPTTEERG